MKQKRYIVLSLILTLGAMMSLCGAAVLPGGNKTYHYICQDSVFLVNGKQVLQSGEYYVTHLLNDQPVADPPGGDANIDPAWGPKEEIEDENSETPTPDMYVDTLVVTVYPVAETIIQASICQGEEFQLPTGAICTTTGIYSDTLIAYNGCDSIITVQLNVFARYAHYDTLQVRGVDMPYLWRDSLLTEAGDYVDTFTCVHGCDSSYYLHLEVKQNFVYTISDDFCPHDTLPYYEWRGQHLTTSGVYYDSLKTENGEDSVYILHLYAHEAYHQTANARLCEGSSLKYNGTKISKPGIYTFKLQSQYGCDSIVDLVVEFNPIFTAYDTVRFCNNEVLEWRGQTIDHSGTYYDRYKSEISGCDSIYQLYAIMKPCYLYVTDTTVCSTDLPYLWRGIECAESKQYEDQYISIHGYDSIYRLNLTIQQATDTTIYLSLPSGTYHYIDTTFSRSGIYTQSITNKMGCDSIITLSVTIHDVVKNDTISDNQTYLWRRHHGGDTIVAKEGLYTQEIPVPMGLLYENGHVPGDTLRLTVLGDFHRTYADTICENQLLNRQPYTMREGGKEYWGQWDGKNFKDSTYQSFDHQYTFTLHVLPERYHKQSFTICAGEAVERILHTGEHVSYTESGTYTDIIPPIPGTWMCDSIDVYVVTVLPTQNSVNTIHIADTTHTYTWTAKDPNGNTVATRQYTWQTPIAAGIQYDQITYTAANGCTATVSLELHIHPTYLIEEPAVMVCPNELPYRWQGMNLNSTGTYTKTYKTETYRYDSIHSIHFTVLPDYVKHYNFTFCRGDSLVRQGKTYYTPGTYTEKLQTKLYGCDSIEIIDIHWYDTYFTSIQADAEEGTSYIWNIGDKTHTLNQSGIYRDTIASLRNGCDSIVELTLTMHKSYLYEEEVSVCPSQLPYLWQNRLLKTSDTYTAEYKTHTYGYDSIHTIHFHVIESDTAHFTYNVCAGERVTHNNKVYERPGFYFDHLTSHAGCDSIESIRIIWHETFFTQLPEAHTSDKVPYVWTVGEHTFTLDHTGVFRDTLTSKLTNCDSIVELKLTVYPTYNITEDAIICASELPYQWRGQECWETGLYHKEEKTYQWGYDSIFNLNLTVLDTAMTYHYIELCHGQTLSVDNHVFSESGFWQDTLQNQAGCDSVVTYRVNILPAYEHSESAITPSNVPYLWQDTILTHSGTYSKTVSAINGCDSVLTLHLLVYDNEVIRTTSAEVCRNDLPYEWRGKAYYESDTYYDTISTLTTDTIWALSLQVLDTDHETIERTLCENDVFEFNGLRITQDTIFRTTISTGLGCGKVYSVYVRFRKPTIKHTNIHADDALGYTWDVNHKHYTQSDIYRDTVKTQDGLCDSIISILTLTMERHRAETVTLCQGEKFVFRGRTYDQNGTTFYDTIHNVLCDTVIRYDIHVLPTHDTYLTADISDKMEYAFNNQMIHNAGDYTQVLTNRYGCDSVVHLTLNVHPTYYFAAEQLTTCANEPLFWHNKYYDQTGTYYDAQKTEVWGYDSIYTLNLTVYPNKDTIVEMPIKTGSIVNIDGLTIDKPGIYDAHLFTSHGCDSIVHYIVKYTDYRNEYSVTICEGESYTFWGEEYTTSTTLRHQIDNNSIEVCHLTVLPTVYTDHYIVLYPGEFPYTFEGRMYLQPGVYEEHYMSALHCDSVYRVTLVESEHCSDWDEIPLCTGGSITIDTTVITQPGAYTFIRRSDITGQLDSLYRVHVYHAPAYEWTDYREICKGDTLNYGGQQFTRSGQYDLRFKTKKGCDSIMHLNLTVHPTYHYYEDAIITDYESYIWYGKQYRTAGDYDYSFSSQNGCDSLHTLRLTVVPTQRITTIDTMCVNGSYAWRGKVYTKPGYYTDTLRSLGSNVSTIYSLELHEVMPTIITSASVGEICADADVFPVRFSYTGAAPKTYSITFDAVAQRNGFVNIYDEPFRGEILVPMPLHPQSLYQGHSDYVRPDNYRMRITIDNGVCGIARTDTLIMQVRYPSWIIEQSWYNVVAPLKPEYNGGYQFAQYEWYVNGSKVNTNGLGYIYSNDLKEGDQVVLYAYRRGENYAIPTCPMTIERSAPIVTATPVIIYPASAPRHMPQITLEANTDGQWRIYSSTGALYETGTFTSGKQQINLPAISNCYFVQTVTEDGQSQTEKIIVY